MKNINDLLAQRDHLLRCNDDLIAKVEKESRITTKEEQREMQDNLDQAEAIKAQVEEIRQHEEWVKRSAAAKASTPQENRSTPGVTPTNGELPRNSGPEIEFKRVGNLQSFHGQEGHRAAFRAGQWLLATFLGHPGAQRYCRDYGITEELRAHGESTGIYGGFLVPDELATAIIVNQEKYGLIQRVMRPWPMKSETAGLPRKIGGLTAYFGSEAAALTESTSQWDKVNLVAKKLHVYTKYSKELDADAIVNVVDILVDDIAQALSYKEDLSAFRGDGSSDYDGIEGIVTKLEALTTYAGYVDAETGHDTYDEFDIGDINTLMGALPEYAEPGAAFYCSKQFREAVFGRLLATSGGNNKSDLAGSFQYSFMGFPVYTSPVLHKTPGTTNNEIVCLFGDLNKACSMGVRSAVELAQSEHAHFATDEIALKATERFDFKVHSLGSTTEAGPVVGLVGKTS